MARAWPLRITLFVLTNLAVLVVFGLVLNLTGLGSAFGTSPGALMAMAAVFGFGGSIVSLLLSKRMALWSTGAHIIEQPRTEVDAWLLQTVQDLAGRAGIGTPDVAIYNSDIPNAFATGAKRNDALVAVSTGLLGSMRRDEVRAVLAHEVAHVANGDMVTMSLLQGVLNTFVIVLARVVGTFVDSALRGDDDEGGFGIGYFVATIAAQILFGILASVVVAWFSRRREYRADAGAAELVGPEPMVAALQRLKGGASEPSDLPQDLAAFGIRASTLAGLFSSHPPLDDRIAALQRA